MKRKLLLCLLLVAIMATAVGCRPPASLPKVRVGPATVADFGRHEAVSFKAVPFFPMAIDDKLPKKRKAVAQLEKDVNSRDTILNCLNQQAMSNTMAACLEPDVLSSNLFRKDRTAAAEQTIRRRDLGTYRPHF